MPSNPRDAKQPIRDESGSENYSGKKIPWPEAAVRVRFPPWAPMKYPRRPANDVKQPIQGKACKSYLTPSIPTARKG